MVLKASKYISFSEESWKLQCLKYFETKSCMVA